ncbi:PREDICTED: cytokine-like protein 1 [Nanorana parkeri]|uniref:cytokine-like protein 1 n=1 Tax=Nanorana parkeri TaxID=125878 RepID=UPI000853FDEA|nr:PREDICTED: cytokine-like protein 1 [Nanorana parkeri]
MKLLLSFLALTILFLFTYSAPPTCYSRVVILSKEITESYKTLQRILPAGPCVESLPTTLYLDEDNSCVMTKLRNFVSAPNCGRLPRVTTLMNKARNLYNIMNTACKRDLFFFTNDCEALEHLPTPTPTSVISR